MKTKFLTLLFIALSFILLASFSSNDVKAICDINDLENLNVNTDDIAKYLNIYETRENVQIIQIKVEPVHSQYFLLARDDVNGWTYSIALRAEKGKLYITKGAPINACDCDEFSASVFRIENSEINGCKNCNHKNTLRE